MNFLAHFYIADITDEPLIGHFLGDFVKGRQIKMYACDVRSAILSHRRIDTFIDGHAVARGSRGRFSYNRRHFAGVIVDVCYDHFLARHWDRFGKEPLDVFVQKVYQQLKDDSNLLNAYQKSVLARMIDYDWLGSYYHLNHVGTALDRIAGRLTRGQAFFGSIAEIEENYQELDADFKAFFPDLISFSNDFRCFTH